MAEYLSPAVFIEEVSSGARPIQGVGTSVAGFVGISQMGPIGVETQINSYGQFVATFGGPTDDGLLAFGVKAFFDEGGGSCYVVRTTHFVAGASSAVASSVTFQNTGTGPGTAINVLRVDAASRGAWGNELSVEVLWLGTTSFTIRVSRGGRVVETLTGLTMNPLATSYAPDAVARLSTLVRAVDLVPAASTLSTTTTARWPVVTALQPLTNGANGLALMDANDFIGTSANGIGLHAFDAIDDVNIIAVPETVDRNVHVQGMAYCEARMDCFYVASVAEAAVSPTAVLNYKRAQGTYAGGNAMNSKYGALYAPWIDVIDPRTGDTQRIPPSGAVAGRYARTDGTRGVHKAPAGVVEGRLASVVSLSVAYSQQDQEKLNPQGVNVIRVLSGVGSVIWGARTVSSDPEWRYLSVRRLFLFLEESIAESTSWAVFEPNDAFLRKSVARDVAAFLRLQWRAGALVGTTEEEAFFVKCDEENNPPESVLLGRLITEIGVAVSKPAEFVVFSIAQFEGGSEVSE